MNEVRIGGVTARFNEDGTLYLYQPDSNRLLPKELAMDLLRWLHDALREHDFPEAAPAGLTETELEADKNAAEAREALAAKPKPAARRARTRKAQA